MKIIDDVLPCHLVDHLCCNVELHCVLIYIDMVIHLLLITKHPEGGPGIDQMDNITTRLLHSSEEVLPIRSEHCQNRLKCFHSSDFPWVFWTRVYLI